MIIFLYNHDPNLLSNIRDHFTFFGTPPPSLPSTIKTGLADSNPNAPYYSMMWVSREINAVLLYKAEYGTKIVLNALLDINVIIKVPQELKPYISIIIRPNYLFVDKDKKEWFCNYDTRL